MDFKRSSRISRRLLCILMAAVMVLSLVGCGGEKSPYTFEKNDDGSGYICTGVSEGAGDSLSIPGTYRGKPVTAIGNHAFEGRTELRKVTLPNSVKRIGIWAFSGCTSLAEISLSSQLEVIDQGAFSDCSSLTEFVIPENVASISEFVFGGCTNLKTIVVKARLESLYDRDFFCEDLEVIQIPDSVTSFFATGAQFQYVMTDIYYEGTLEQWLKVDAEFFYTDGLTVHCTDATISWYNGMLTGPGWEYLDYDGGWWLDGGVSPDEDSGSDTPDSPAPAESYDDVLYANANNFMYCVAESNADSAQTYLPGDSRIYVEDMLPWYYDESTRYELSDSHHDVTTGRESQGDWFCYSPFEDADGRFDFIVSYSGGQDYWNVYVSYIGGMAFVTGAAFEPYYGGSQSGESYAEPVGFVPDYSSEAFANTRSVLGVPDYGYYYFNYSPVKRQDQMLYYIGNDAIKKIPVGGSEADIQVILDGLYDEYGTVYEFQIVGDWVYFMSFCRSTSINNHPCEIMRLSRVRTDGMLCETIADNILRPKQLNSEDFNTFAVYGDWVYYVGIVQTQTSATAYDVESQVCRYNPDTGITEIFKWKDAENPNFDSYVISSYNSDTILVEDLENDTFYLYRYDDGSFTEAPGIAGFSFYDFYDDGRGGYIGYGVGTLRAFNESNGYSGEVILDSVNPAGVAQVRKSELVIYGDQIFTNFTDINTNKGLQVIENGERRSINGDFGQDLSYPGDGYLYYTYSSNLYRVRPDGSGWEQLYW